MYWYEQVYPSKTEIGMVQIFSEINSYTSLVLLGAVPAQSMVDLGLLKRSDRSPPPTHSAKWFISAIGLEFLFEFSREGDIFNQTALKIFSFPKLNQSLPRNWKVAPSFSLWRWEMGLSPETGELLSAALLLSWPGPSDFPTLSPQLSLRIQPRLSKGQDLPYITASVHALPSAYGVLSSLFPDQLWL